MAERIAGALFAAGFLLFLIGGWRLWLYPVRDPRVAEVWGADLEPLDDEEMRLLEPDRETTW